MRPPRPLGVVTRGTTNPNRLRRVDGWIAYACGDLIRGADDPLVVDLGYGATPITAVELRARLAASVRADVRVVGLEIDPVRVAGASSAADPPWLTFRRGASNWPGSARWWCGRSTCSDSTRRPMSCPRGQRWRPGSPTAG